MSPNHKVRTLWMAGMLHAFTHVYQVALLPLYFSIQADFKLASVGQATVLVTVLMTAYFLPSYPVGVMADRFSRKTMLGWGLLINAVGFIGLGLSRDYTAALVCVVISGIGGSFYHPAATALVARLYPVGTGKALGLTGVGASIGFFFGPFYTGWRAAMLEPTLGPAAWRQPIIELGIAGVIAAGFFAWLAEEAPPAKEQHAPLHAVKMFPTSTLWLFFLAACFLFSLRDFAGSSMGSLGSLYLQSAQGYNVRETGSALSW
ncbi:MAG TPA: MFS transporter, partial [Candidatus Eisenbacteria bacterium]|nr:MFS transporter [Candidatus Eisenbacteria bacterium]